MKYNQPLKELPLPLWRRIVAYINIALLLFYNCLPGTVAAYELVSNAFIRAEINNNPQFTLSTSNNYLTEKAYYVTDTTSISTQTIASFHQKLFDHRKTSLPNPLMIPIINDGITLIIPHYPLEKQVGDSFVQARFIRSQIFNQLNRNLLNDAIGTEAQQINALYNRAFEFSGKSSKRFGDKLTRDDVNGFGHDFIWPELRTVNNQKVLVPIVHLTDATIDAQLVDGHIVEFSGAETQFNNININSGTLLTRRNSLLNVAGNLNISEGATLKSDYDLNVLVGGTLQNISGQISAENNVNIIAGQYLQKTIVHRYATKTTQGSRLGQIASVDANGNIYIKTAGDLVVKGGTISGNNIMLRADGHIVLQSQETTYVRNQVVGGWNENESIIQQLGSQLTAEENIRLIAAGAIEINASTLHADQGTVEILAGQGVYILNADGQFQSQRHGKFGRTTIQEQEFQTIAIRSAIEAGKGVVIATEFGDVNLKGSQITSTSGTEIIARNGAVNFLLTKEQSNYFYNKVVKGFWKIKTTTQQDNVETAVYNEIIGGVKVQATHGMTLELGQYEDGDIATGINTETSRISAEIKAISEQIEDLQRRGQSADHLIEQRNTLSQQLLDEQLEQLAQTDSLAWMQTLHNDPEYTDNFNIVYQELVELHKFDKTSTLSPAAMAIIAIAVAVAMGPGGAGWLGSGANAIGQVGFLSAQVAQAGALAIATQAATGLASGQGLENTVKSLFHSDNIKATATAMVTAGALEYFKDSATFFDNVPTDQDFSSLTQAEKLQTIAYQTELAVRTAVVRTGVSTIINGGDLGDFGDAFVQSLAQAGISALGEAMAESIADAAENQDWSLVFKYAAHAGAGCIVGELSDITGVTGEDQGCATGALGSTISAIVTDSYEAAKQDEIDQLLNDEIAYLTQQRIDIGDAGAFKNIASAKKNIFRQKMVDLQSAGVDLAKLGSALMAAATSLDVNLAVSTAGYTATAETQHYVFTLIDVIDEVNHSVFANQIINSLPLTPLEPISADFIEYAKSLGLNIYNENGAIIYEDEFGQKFNIIINENIEKITAYAEELQQKLIVLQDKNETFIERIEALWQKLDDAEREGYLRHIEARMRREAGYEDLDLTHIGTKGGYAQLLQEFVGVSLDVALAGLPSLIAYVTGGDTETPLVDGVIEDVAASTDLALGLEEGTTLAAIEYTLLGKDLLDVGHLTASAIKGSVALTKYIKELRHKRDTQGLTAQEQQALDDALQQNKNMQLALKDFQKAEGQLFISNYANSALKNLRDLTGSYKRHPSGIIQGPNDGFFINTGSIDPDTGMPILQRIGKKVDGSPDFSKPGAYVTVDPTSNYAQTAANTKGLSSRSTISDYQLRHKVAFDRLADDLLAQDGNIHFEVSIVSDSVLGARSDGIITGGVGQSFTVPDGQYAYRVEFTGEYKTINGHQVPIYTETKVNEIILQDNGSGVGSAILEMKTGPTARLTINQSINYQAAINGCGSVCGNKANSFVKDQKFFTNTPDIVYIIRDTEL